MRRGEASWRGVGLSFGLVVVSFLINFLAEFWPAAKGIAWLSVLQYYQPAQIVRDDVWPIGDFLVLAAVAIAAWVAGAIVFERRAIRTP